ncbi:MULTISPECIES: MFS transporter [Thalassobaculum]|uniref:Predicted arabinose efflux permease, MFS family n=1 Tax=Thalassobaculum litoreum DSM 18839 TaxID=1123362 RepID=A0A8G2BJB6_9PROT|nr:MULTISPECIES: MFS transporter [Thalassobaculum]SDG03202.1 Predicted arabinose efflux permease, MFS family [Thalassobaculum litoreum DSM 18839]
MSTLAHPSSPGWRTPVVVIVAGCLIAMIGFGIRSAFGLFLEPMTLAKGWDRETFGLAMAIQNLLWGIGVPVAGMIADKFGPSRVLAVGAVIYTVGVWGMATADSSLELHLFGGVLTGIGVAFTAFSLAMAAMAKVVGPERRSLALGLGTAAGSFGQVVFSPLGQGFIGAYGWESALLMLAASALFIIPLAFILPSNTNAKGEVPSNQTFRQAMAEAGAHRGYILLTIGFFVCGFHVAFITVHFPSYVRDLGLDPTVGAYSLALVGLFNIIGSFASGMAGQRWSKKVGLSTIYFARAIVIIALLMAPKTELTIYLFAGAMGILWLSTVPLTTGIVAQIFGVKYMATLFGFVFLSHQLGSFAGIWLGGYLYDTTGSYDGVWWAGVVLGLAAAIIHLPINEKPLARLTPVTV